jgi:hypothetical protein
MYNALTNGGIIASPEEAAARAAQLRKKRLNKPANNLCLGVTLDLIFGAGPWIAYWLILCGILVPLHQYVDGATDVFSIFNAPVAVSAIAAFASFLLVTRQSAQLGNNAKIIGEFGNLSGSLVNVCLFVKSQISSGKSIEFINLADGSGGFFKTTKIGLVCASVMYSVKYTGRGEKIWAVGLPIGQDPTLLRSYTLLTSASNGSPGMSSFNALLLMLGELIDDFQVGERASEYAVLFGQINAVRAIFNPRPLMCFPLRVLTSTLLLSHRSRPPKDRSAEPLVIVRLC